VCLCRGSGDEEKEETKMPSGFELGRWGPIHGCAEVPHCGPREYTELPEASLSQNSLQIMSPPTRYRMKQRKGRPNPIQEEKALHVYLFYISNFHVMCREEKILRQTKEVL